MTNSEHELEFTFAKNRIQPNPRNPVPTNGYPVPKPGNMSTHYISVENVPGPEFD